MIQAGERFWRRGENGVGARQDVADGIDDKAEQVLRGLLGVGGGMGQAGKFGGGFKNDAAGAAGVGFGAQAEAVVQIEGGEDLSAQVNEAANHGRGAIHGGECGLAEDFSDPKQIAGVPTTLSLKGKELRGGGHGRVLAARGK